MTRVLYPFVFHVRCDAAMRDEVKARGGGDWLRSLIKANTRSPANDNPPWEDAVSRAIASDTSAAVTRSVPRGRKGKGRVSLDKRKRRLLKSRQSRLT